MRKMDGSDDFTKRESAKEKEKEDLVSRKKMMRPVWEAVNLRFLGEAEIWSGHRYLGSGSDGGRLKQ